MPSVSILMTVANRPKQLALSLQTLCGQNLNGMDCEIVVIDDGEEGKPRRVAKRFAKKYPFIRYLFTGQRNKKGLTWRAPGFCLNIAIQQCESDIIILTNADVFHLGKTIQPLLDVAKNHPQAIATVEEVYDDDGRLMNYFLHRGEYGSSEMERIVGELKKIPDEVRWKAPRPDPRDPHLWAIRRSHIMDIGGYDEDFTGYACEDTDLAGRLCDSGCYFVYTQSEILHLFHGDRLAKRDENQAAYEYNLDLLNSRRGQIVRNVGRAWGVAAGDA